MKEPIDPKDTPAYNHYRIDGDKPVIPNRVFKETYDSESIEEIERVLSFYALVPSQKYMLEQRLKKLYENKKNLPPL